MTIVRSLRNVTEEEIRRFFLEDGKEIFDDLLMSDGFITVENVMNYFHQHPQLADKECGWVRESWNPEKLILKELDHEWNNGSMIKIEGFSIDLSNAKPLPKVGENGRIKIKMKRLLENITKEDIEKFYKEKDWSEYYLSKNSFITIENVMNYFHQPTNLGDTYYGWTRNLWNPRNIVTHEWNAKKKLNGVSVDNVYYLDISNAIIISKKYLFIPDEDYTSPDHYTFSKYEPRKVIAEWGLNFNLGNVIKYVARAGRKDGASVEEDLKKAIRYLEFELEEWEKFDK